MKKVITILIALFVSANTSVQAQDCLWAKSAGGTASDEGISTCTDASGNVFVTGSFYSPTITFGTTILTNEDNSGTTSDIFIAKYASDGSVLWAKSAGGSGYDFGEAVSADNIGNVYVTGRFQSQITFGTSVLTSSGFYDMFVVKYTPNGTVEWSSSAGGNGFDASTSISNDANGNVYVTGSFASASISFGTTTLTNTTGNGTNVFIVKYTQDGTVLWANSSGDAGLNYGKTVSTDSNGNVFVSGIFNGATITFGTTTLNNVSNFFDIFIAKYDTNGNVLWAKSAGGNKADVVNGISTDNSGNVYLIGEFYSMFLPFGTTTLTNADNTTNTSDVFMAKYDPNGTVLWAKLAGGSFDDFGSSVSIDESDNVYISGAYTSPTISFGTSTLTNADNSGTTSDIYFVSYSSEGIVLQTKSVGGSSDDFGKSIAIDASGYLYLTGYFKSASLGFGTFTLTNAGDNDLFIAKYNGPTTGVTESLTNTKLIVSPNPTNSSIMLSMPNLKNSNISITTLTGIEVGTYTTQNTSTQTIDISHLASGVYFVSLKSEEGVVTKKIIKQ